MINQSQMLDTSKTYFVTGVAGFIGFHLARRLLNEGCSVIGLDNLNDYYDVNLKEQDFPYLRVNRIPLVFASLHDEAAINKVFTDEKSTLWSIAAMLELGIA